MSFTFSSMSGSSGITQITISATSTQELADVVNHYTLGNESTSLDMPVVQKAYVPVQKYITMSPSAITWSSSNNTGSITINSNDSWVVVSDGWIQVSRMYESDISERYNSVSGNGNTIIGISCFENIGDARSGGITAYCQSNSAISATTTVSQAGGYVKPYITLGTYSMQVSGGSVTTAVTVQSNVSWTATTDSNWVTLNTLTGSGNGNVSFTVSTNTSSIERRATITVFNGEINAVLVLTQAASVSRPYIILSPNSFSVPYEGSTGNTISVSANCDYDIEADVNWITVNAVSGSGNGSVSFSTSAMTGSSVGNIVFSNSAVTEYATVEIAFIPYLSANTNNILSYSTGGTFEISVYSNVNWSVSVDMGEGELSTPWLSVIPSSGSNNSSIRISVDSGYTAASGSVVLSSTEYGLSWLINVERRKYVNNSVIFYTSTGNTVINVPTTGWGGGVNFVSNTYENGQGVIVFDNDVINIPSYGFYDSDLSSIILPESVEYLFNYAFYGCDNLKSITMPPCEILSAWTFGWNSINEVNFLGTLEQWITADNLIASSWGGHNDVIDPNGFDLYLDGELLTHADFSSYSGAIRMDAISQCKSLTGVTIGENVTYIGNKAFICPNLVYVSYNAINAAGPTPSSYPIYNDNEFGSITTFEIGENVEKITNMVIGSGGSLTTIYAHPRVVPDISTAYFRAAENGTLHYPNGSDYSTLISRLPSGWTAVDDIIPTGDYLIVSPTGFTVDATGSTGNQISITSNVSYNISSNVNWITLSDSTGSGNKTITFDTSATTETGETSGVITVSSSTKSKTVSITRQAYIPPQPQIPNNEIHYTTTGGTVLAPYTTTGWGSTILSNTYNDGQGILEFRGNVTAFPYNAYSNKSELQTIEIPNSVTVISGQSFIYCSNLQEVTIGSGVTSILNYAFYSCSSLATIYAHPTTAPTLGTGVFGVASSGTLHYPSGSDYSSWISALPSGWTAVADL